MIAHNVGPSRRVREEYPESLGASQSHGDLFRLFECSSSFAGLLELHEGELGEDFYLFDNTIVGHDVHHLLPIEVLGDAAKPKLTYQNTTRLVSNDFFGDITRGDWVVSRRGIGRVRITLDGWIGLVWHVVRRVWHLGRVRPGISLHF